jgi:hypothetical protein
MIPPTVVSRLLRRHVRESSLCGAAALLSLIACSSFLEPLPAPRPLSVELPETAIADGATLTPVVVHVDTTLGVDKRTVTLTTTAGSFVGDANAIIPNETGTAIALLQSPTDSTIAIVRAKVNGVVNAAQIIFRRARPERIDLLLGAFTLKAGVANELTVTAKVRRTVGTPSPGAVVSFAATDGSADHKPVGTFLPSTAVVDAQGVATVRFTSADSTVRGPVAIHVSSDSATATATVQVVAP